MVGGVHQFDELVGEVVIGAAARRRTAVIQLLDQQIACHGDYRLDRWCHDLGLWWSAIDGCIGRVDRDVGRASVRGLQLCIISRAANGEQPGDAHKEAFLKNIHDRNSYRRANHSSQACAEVHNWTSLHPNKWHLVRNRTVGRV